jgi:hypothetical protein
MAQSYRKPILEEADSRDTPTQQAAEYCNVCRFAMVPDATSYRCRRDPPVNGVQPTVKGTDWCGSYEIGTPYVPAPPPASPPAPVNAVLPRIEQVANVISCTTGNWSGTPTNYKYDWRMDGKDVGPGTENPNYITVSADIGKTATCILTARNDWGEASVTSNAIVVADPALPVPENTTIPYASQAGDTLNCTMGEWTGTPSAYFYQWKVDGAPVGDGSADYVATSEQEGRDAMCVVSASNISGSGTAPPSNTVTIAHWAPPRSARQAPHRNQGDHDDAARHKKED